MDAALISKIIVWILVGTLAGALAGMVVKRQRSGFGHLGNLAVGLVGAAIGLFAGQVLELKLGLADIAINLDEVLLAFIGSMVFLAVLAICRRFFGKKNKRGELES